MAKSVKNNSTKTQKPVKQVTKKEPVNKHLVEYKEVKGHPSTVIKTLNKKIGQYKTNHTKVKVGITGRSPQERFDEHRQNHSYWQRMIVIYETTSSNYANQIEKWLVEQHQDELVNQRSGGGSLLAQNKKSYVYVLLG